MKFSAKLYIIFLSNNILIFESTLPKSISKISPRSEGGKCNLSSQCVLCGSSSFMQAGSDRKLDCPYENVRLLGVIEVEEFEIPYWTKPDPRGFPQHRCAQLTERYFHYIATAPWPSLRGAGFRWKSYPSLPFLHLNELNCGKNQTPLVLTQFSGYCMCTGSSMCVCVCVCVDFSENKLVMSWCILWECSMTVNGFSFA